MFIHIHACLIPSRSFSAIMRGWSVHKPKLRKTVSAFCMIMWCLSHFRILCLQQKKCELEKQAACPTPLQHWLPPNRELGGRAQSFRRCFQGECWESAHPSALWAQAGSRICRDRKKDSASFWGWKSQAESLGTPEELAQSSGGEKEVC